MKWLNLNSIDQLGKIIENSKSSPQIIFKHSTTCPISSMAKLRFEEAWNVDYADCYYLDLLAYRSISNEVAERFAVHHESPQLILIHNEEVILDASHMDISVKEILEVFQYHNIS